MERHLVPASLCLLAGLAAQAPSIEWQTDFIAARQLAADRHTPLFVVFRCER